MSMTATARPIDGTLRHEVEVNGRHTIITDEPTRLGGTDAGPAPHELLPAMLAGVRLDDDHDLRKRAGSRTG